MYILKKISVTIHIYKLYQHTDCSKALKGISLLFLDAYVRFFVCVGEVKELGHLLLVSDDGLSYVLPADHL